MSILLNTLPYNGKWLFCLCIALGGWCSLFYLGSVDFRCSGIGPSCHRNTVSPVCGLSLFGFASLLTLIRRSTRKNELDLSSMTAAWLLPIVSCVIAAASGAIVADILPNAQLALATILASYIL